MKIQTIICIMLFLCEIVSAEEPKANMAMVTEDDFIEVKCSLTTEKPDVGGPITAKVILARKIGQDPIEVTVSNDMKFLNPELTYKGQKVPFTMYGELLGSYPTPKTTIPIAPGQDHLYTINISRCFDLSMTGEYEFNCSVYYSTVTTPSMTLKLKPIKFTVVDSDANEIIRQ